MNSLSKIQQQTLTQLGITQWSLSEQGKLQHAKTTSVSDALPVEHEAPVAPNKALFDTAEALVPPNKTLVDTTEVPVAPNEAPADTTEAPAAAIEAPVERTIEGVQLVLEAQTASFIQDVLQAWNKLDLPCQDRPSNTSFEAYRYRWQHADEVSLRDNVLSTPTNSPLTATQKRALWQCLQQQ